MSYQLVAISPDSHPIKIGLGQQLPEHALEDRDALRETYAKHQEFGWRVEVWDADGRVMEWDDIQTSVTAGEAA